MTLVAALDCAFLFLARLDLVPRHEQSALAWLDQEFLPMTAAQLGAQHAFRARCTEGEPTQVIAFGMDSLEAAREQAPMPRTSDMLDYWMKNYEANWFRAASQAGKLRGDCPFINLIQTQVRPTAAVAFDDWYRTVHAPEMLDCPGWLSSRRFAGLSAPGSFLAAYELSDPVTPFTSPQFSSAVGWDGFESDLIGYHGFRIYEVQKAF